MAVAKRGKRSHPAGCLDRPARGGRSGAFNHPPKNALHDVIRCDTAADHRLRAVFGAVPAREHDRRRYFATRITQNVSNFEGGAGYAALWWIFILTCAFCGLSIALCVLLRKRTAVLAVITVGFAVLSVPTFRLVYELAT
ncbi:hypothetical protein [Burkholderia metallica]|uniref:hypothetical protein n=1 Tax=Burkholderia metallica TaxID=488729 RepID=UPI0020C5CDDE|nr:hypothetical protein [Burkholderia metallica]